jgi:ABC-2 type transport system ATP-binding protein
MTVTTPSGPAAADHLAQAPTAIEVDGLVKDFTLRHNRSLKELAMAKVRRKPISDSFRALDGVDLHVRQGESVALLGFNGSGKSTLLKLISGVLQPDGGSIGVRGRIAGLIEVGAGFHPDLTGRENVFLNGAILGMDEATITARFDDIVAFSEIEKFIDTEVKFYSSGMFLRLAFAVAVHTDPEVFLIDEILSVGDEPFQRKCLARIEELRAEGRTLVIVSHDLDMVAELCTRGVLLEGGRVVADESAVRVVARMRGQDPDVVEREHAEAAARRAAEAAAGGAPRGDGTR